LSSFASATAWSKTQIAPRIVKCVASSNRPGNNQRLTVNIEARIDNQLSERSFQNSFAFLNLAENFGS
jgi:hypothetical protein